MAVITISRGCYSHGKEIAEKVAAELGYESMSHEMLIREASEKFHVAGQKLEESIEDAPSFLDRLMHVRERFLLFARAALLEHLARDNVVYHGHAGHLLVPGAEHVLKVRVTADMEERIALVTKKRHISREEAIERLKKEDKQRAEWNRTIGKIDPKDPSVYDIMIHLGRLKIEDACEMICTAARSDSLKSTPESLSVIRDTALACHVKAALQDLCKAQVRCESGVVNIIVEGQKLKKTGAASGDLQNKVRETIAEDLENEILARIRSIQGVEDVTFEIAPPFYS